MHVAWYILYAVCVIATLAIPFFVEAPGSMISSASLVIGIISLWLTHITLITAKSIRGLKSTQSLVEQLKELATEYSKEGEISKPLTAKEKDRLSGVVQTAKDSSDYGKNAEAKKGINALSGFISNPPSSKSPIVDKINHLIRIL